MYKDVKLLIESYNKIQNKSGLKRTINNAGVIRYRLPNGLLHRDDGPAVEYSRGDKYAKPHKEGERDTTKEWYINGKRHRTDGPAIEYANGDKYWFKHDKLHREDGPALMFDNGSMHWYLDGVEYSQEEYNVLLRKKEFAKHFGAQHPDISDMIM
jgi:hypothetical protein